MPKKDPTVVDLLKRTRALLRKGWTQGTYARSKGGRKVSHDSKSAVSFDLYGAVNRAAAEIAGNLFSPVVRLLKRCLPAWETIDTFNDAPGRKKSEVIAVVSRAIEKAEAAR